jgi:hypothetical protein
VRADEPRAAGEQDLPAFDGHGARILADRGVGRSRRAFVGALACLCAAAFPAGAPAQAPPAPLGESSLVRVGLLDVGAGDPAWSEAAAALAGELRARTSVEPAPDAPRVRIGDAALFRTPLLVLTGREAFAMPSPADLSRLRRHLTYGGMLLVDDALARPGGAFDAAARALVRALFPDEIATAVRPNHVLFKSFYLLDAGVQGAAGPPALEAIERDGRIVVLFGPGQLGGALAARDEAGVRLAVNVVLYALCLDYKEDQVHVPFILRRRRWRPEP